MTHTALTTRLQALNPTYRQLIVGTFIPESAELFGSGENLSPDQILVLENGLALYLLFFLTDAELVGFIRRECNVDTTTAERIVYAFRATLPPQFLSEHKALCAALNPSDPNTTPPPIVPPAIPVVPLVRSAAPIVPPVIPPAPAATELASDIAEAEAALRSLEPVRTMAHDMDVIRHTQTPSPAAATRPITVKSDSAPLEHTARWDSER